MYSHYLPKVIHSVRQLTELELWHKEMPNLNTIGGIVLHICEHVRRISSRFADQHHPGFSQGIEEYFPDLHLTPEELAQTVEDVFREFYTLMDKLIENKPEEIDMHSLYHLVEHTGYHLGQIVDRSQRIAGKSFAFCQNGINERNLKEVIEE